MIYPGTDLKFQIIPDIDGFDISKDNFLVAVLDRCGRTRWSVTRDECFEDADGNWYFTIENVKTGIYFVKFTAYIPDSDYDKLYRLRTDVQPLCMVGFCEGQMPCMCDCDKGLHKVDYRMVWTAELDDGTYLCGSDGVLILTEDGSRIKIKE